MFETQSNGAYLEYFGYNPEETELLLTTEEKTTNQSMQQLRQWMVTSCLNCVSEALTRNSFIQRCGRNLVNASPDPK